MKPTIALLAAALLAAFALTNSVSAQVLLSTGAPTSGDAVYTLGTNQSFAGEFAATAGEDVTIVGAYLTQGVGQPGDTFDFDIYSGLPGNTFLSRSSQREAPIATILGTFTVNGWNYAATNWTVATTGDYWLALQVPSTTYTRGLDLPTGSNTGPGPGLDFAVAGSSGQYATSLSDTINLYVAPEPSSWMLALLCVGFFGYLRSRSARA